MKNLDTKEIWEFSKSFVKREGILLLACVLKITLPAAFIDKDSNNVMIFTIINPLRKGGFYYVETY